MRYRPRMPRSSTVLLHILLVGGLWGCQPRYPKVVELADGTTPRPPNRRLLSVQFRIAPDANDNSPVALSLLLIYDPALMRQLSGLSAAEWFEKREQLLRDATGRVDEVLWEFIPGQEVPPYTRPLRPQPAEGLLFARYPQSRPHRYPFSPEQPLFIELQAREVRVEPAP